MKRSFLCAAIVILGCGLALSQATYKVIYNFGTNPTDGSIPNGGLIFDHAGNLYGTTQNGGSGVKCEFCGTVFELSPSQGGVWSETVIYNFCSQTNCTDGDGPATGLIFDTVGNLYGTTVLGGINNVGTVFELSPPLVPGGSWIEKVLWSFGSAPDDGGVPYGRLNWDASGNLYGTGSEGGDVVGGGIVLKLSPNGDGSWAETVLYAFCTGGDHRHCPDGLNPMAGVSFDKSGNLYGTTWLGGFDDKWGVLYKLSPPPASGERWTETVLYKFVGTGGGQPLSVVNFDKAGNAYVTASTGASNSPGLCGGVFKFAPGGKKLSYLFYPNETGCRPYAGVFLDNKTGALYGTTKNGGIGGGNLYEIVGKNAKVLYTFCSQPKCADGVYPTGSLTPNGGKLYSTTSQGGEFNQGVVFEIGP